MHTPYSYRDDAQVPPFADDRPIILFDGFCVLCSRWAQFVLRHDRQECYRLLAAQSPLGQAIYRHYGLDPIEFESNMLLADGRMYLKSDGIIRMFVGLGFPWSFVRMLRIIPPVLRDRMYATLARNRFKWFGKRLSCYMPQEKYKDRFL